jgi:hypothetical protein
MGRWGSGSSAPERRVVHAERQLLLTTGGALQGDWQVDCSGHVALGKLLGRPARHMSGGWECNWGARSICFGLDELGGL